MKPRQYARRARTISRAVILTRVSTDSQSDNTSHETQIKACQKFCRNRGWEVIATFEEVESGTLYLSRVETQAALELIEAHKADALVLYDMSRYGRDVEYQHKILKRIVAAGAQLQFATFPLEYDATGELTPESEQMFNLLGGTSSAERKYIRRRLSAGKARKVSQGIQLARTMSPWGWKIVDKKSIIRGEYAEQLEGFYIPIPATLEIVKDQIFIPYAAGSSLGQIANQLAESQIPTP
jgi:site-specific DNA recombinase